MLGNTLVEGLELKITQFPNGFCLNNYLLHSISHGHILVLTHCSLQFRKYEIKYKSSPRKNSLQVYILILINFLIQVQFLICPVLKQIIKHTFLIG